MVECFMKYYVPVDRMGADKLLAEARFGSINGPLKFVTLRIYLSAPC